MNLKWNYIVIVVVLVCKLQYSLGRSSLPANSVIKIEKEKVLKIHEKHEIRLVQIQLDQILMLMNTRYAKHSPLTDSTSFERNPMNLKTITASEYFSSIVQLLNSMMRVRTFSPTRWNLILDRLITTSNKLSHMMTWRSSKMIRIVVSESYFESSTIQRKRRNQYRNIIEELSHGMENLINMRV